MRIGLQAGAENLFIEAEETILNVLDRLGFKSLVQRKGTSVLTGKSTKIHLMYLPIGRVLDKNGEFAQSKLWSKVYRDLYLYLKKR